MLRRHLLALGAILAGTACLFAADRDPYTYEKDVRPILKEHCFHCHGEAGVTEGELDLRLRRWIVAGGDSGAALVPGDPQQSLLIERVRSGDMPPGDTRVAPEQIEVIVAWIKQGAVTARAEPESLEDGDYITEEERNHWAFQPVTRPDPPSHDPATLPAGAAIENPVDAFVSARLTQHGLAFSDAADRATLIRRATFDLWGLPPTSDMVEQFVRDDQPLAYERLIDRLLSSPRYGERWARHWLDVAGYADSDGYTDRDSVREFAYFYRDYVIESLNANKPLDVFICEQLAGDEMAAADGGAVDGEWTQRRIEQLAATGFLRTAPDGTAEGSVDRGVAANDTIASTIEIVSTSLLGMTVGCARCHDHRYDPISQADYYRFRALFEPALDWKAWKVPSQRRVSLYTAEDRETRNQIERHAKEAEAARQKRQQEHIDRTLEEELLVVPDAVRESLRSAFRTPKSDRTAQQIALLEEYPSVGNISAGSLYLYAQQRARRAGDIERVAGEREATYVRQLREQHIAELPESDRQALLALLDISEDQRTDDQKQLAQRYAEIWVTADQLKELWPEKHAEIQRYRQAAKICREQDAKTELAKLQEQIVAIRAEAPKERFLRVLQEPAGHQPDTHLFVRGDHNQPGKVMRPSELTVLRSDPGDRIAEDDSELATSGRRLAYARHLTSGEHPLLARVLVNRVWLHHFGRGIVATPGDFGRLGTPPTHPELLDWLASELVRSGWDLKHLHRLMMQSHTYRQQSRRSDVLDEVDPDNRWYARMSVRRLESEAVRDAMLAVSGGLIHRMHGPPVPVKEDGVGQIVLGVEMLDGERKPTGSEQSFEGQSRRSVYVQVRRTRPLAVLETFDVASSAPNCTARNFSNVATQSLMMMNSQFAIDRASQMADDLISAGGLPEDQLADAWKRCFASDIENSVLVELLAFRKTQSNAFQEEDASLSPADAERRALASVCQVLLSANEFLYVD